MEKRSQRDRRRRRRRRRRKKTHHHHHHHLQRHRIYPRSMHFCAHDRRGLPRRRAPAPFPKIERHSISSARKRRIKTRCCCCLLPSKSPFAKSPTDFFAASTRNDATRREERCAIFLLATVLAGAARNANFCADAAANEDMFYVEVCVFWRSDAREKCRFPDCDYTSLSSPMDIYIGPTRRIFSLFFFRLGKTRKAQNEATRREKDFTFYTWKEGDKINTTQTHKKEREKKKLDT